MAEPEAPPAGGRDWSALDFLRAPALALDARGALAHANRAARACLGELRPGVRLPDLHPQLRHPVLESGVRQALASGEEARFTVSWKEPPLEGRYEVTASPADGGAVVVLHPHPGFAAVPGSDPERISEGLVRAGMALSSASSLDEVLQVMADVSRELVGARYAAMGVINPEGTALSAFIVSGMSPEQRARMGDLPTGHGILGLLIRDPHPIRLSDLREHPASVGIPRNHPPMHSFLGVPVMANGRVFGNLYVTEKEGAAEFSEADRELVETVAAQAAIAIENAQLRRARDRFFAAASHELGNAVTGVQVWARHLLRRPPESAEALVEGLRHMQNGADHACRLIDDILSLSRMEEGRLTLDAWRVDVGEIAREAVMQLAPGADSAGVEVRHVVSPDAPVVEADPVRVRQILVNLLANAIKFTPAGKTIRVEVGPDAEGDGIHAVVRDEGPGVAPEDRERIFEPYQQVRGVARGRGTGLGLPLSRRLARLMGGDLWVESEPGRGSLFVLRLPPVMPVVGKAHGLGLPDL